MIIYVVLERGAYSDAHQLAPLSYWTTRAAAERRVAELELERTQTSTRSWVVVGLETY
jgi:hypothetical protein